MVAYPVRRRFFRGLPYENGRSVLPAKERLLSHYSTRLCRQENDALCRGYEFLQESDAKGRLAGPTGTADNAREWRLKF